MAQWNEDNMRDWPKYGERRVPEGYSDVVTLLKDVDNNLPTNVDLRGDSSALLNCLVVRQGSSMTINTDKPKFVGLSYSREHYSIEDTRAYGSTDSVTGDHTSYESNGIRGVLPAQEMLMIAEAARAYQGRSSGQSMLNGNNWIMQKNGDGQLLGTRGLLCNPQGLTGTLAAHMAQIRTDPRRLLQLLLTGRSGNGNLPSLSLALTDHGVHDQQSGTLSMAISSSSDLNAYQTQSQRLRLACDKLALEMVPTSALDFVYRWAEPLMSLSQNMGYFKSEFIGFFEKGMRAQFWQRFNDEEIMLLGWFAMLGKALRTGSWANNLYAPTNLSSDLTSGEAGFVSGTGAARSNPGVLSAVEEHAGVYCPFFMRIEDAGRSGETFEYAPWWVASQINNADFANTYTDNPQYGVYQEDVFTGLDMLFRAASLEAGIAWRGVGAGYLDFFEDFKLAKLPDFKSNESRIDDKALKTLWHLGFSSVDEWFANNGVVPTGRLSTAFFNEFTEGTLLVLDQQDILRDQIAELESMEIVSGPDFAEGMQLNGKSQFSVFHRRTTDGDSHSISINYANHAHVRPAILSPTLFINVTGTDIRTSVEAFEGLSGSYTSYMTNASDAPYSGLAAIAPGVRCLLWPSTGAGFHFYGEQVYHSRNHAFVGATGLVLDGTSDEKTPALINTWGTGYGYGAPVYPNGYPVTITVGGTAGTGYYAATPILPAEHWHLGMSGMSVRILRNLTQVYKHWQNRSNMLPFKSQFKGLDFSGINLVSMLTMETGENLIQKNLPAILGIGNCNQSGGWSIQARQIDRLLERNDIHLRPERWGDAATPDIVCQYLPKEVDSTSMFDAFAMYNYMAMLNGTLGRTGLLTAGGAATLPLLAGTPSTPGMLESVHPLTTEFHFYPMMGNDSGTTLYGSNLRTIYIPATGINIGTTEDGETLSKNIIPMSHSFSGTSVPLSLTRGLETIDGAAAVLPPVVHMFNFWDESIGVLTGFTHTNSAVVVPGARYAMDELWTSVSARAAASTTNSMCSLFGLNNSPTTAGSNIANALARGYATTPNEIQNFTKDGVTIAATPTPLQFDIWHYSQYVQERKDELIWQEMQPQLVIWDQDLLDLDTAMLSNMWFLNSRKLLHGYCPYLAIINSDATLSAVHDNVFTITSGGGVATESGSFTGGAESSGPAGDDPATDDPPTSVSSDRSED